MPVYNDFDRMLAEARPDTVIVTTVDRYHHEYIIRALEAGCDVITEKPMTIDDAKCRAILDAEQRTGRKVTVTFNYRFSPYVTRVKELLREGAIGRGAERRLRVDPRHAATAPTTSGAGTAGWRTPAACWCTRPRITST